LALVYSPYHRRYVEAQPLTLYTFKVEDSQTGLPIQGAACAVTDTLDPVRVMEGAGGYTDAGGECTVEALFPARYYTVSKAGYVSVKGTIPGTTINVSLDPTALMYWLTIHAGAGGSVHPSGNYQVAANTRVTVTAAPATGYALDHWLVNNVKQPAVNPITVTVDRDSFSVYAVFKETDAPPPEDGGEWPFPVQLHVLDNVTVAPGWGTYGEASQNVGNVDAPKVLGGSLDLSVAYGRVSASKTSIYWNGTLIGEVDAAPQDSGTRLTKSYSLTGLIRSTNTLKVAYTQPALGFGTVTYDAYVTIGYGEQPITNPTTGRGILEGVGEWARNNAPLLAVGGIAVTGAYVLTRRGPPVIVVTPPAAVYRREEA